MQGEFPLGRPLSEREAVMLSPIRLAYVGDAVYDLLVRTALVFAGGKAGAMHKDAVQRVNAAAQARALGLVQGMLTEAEADIVRRGRNAHAHHAAPRRVGAAEYAQATGLEALLGFLYLTGRTDRLMELYSIMRNPEEDTTCPQSP